MDYYKLLEQFLKEMTAETLDIKAVYAVLAELCKLYRISRGVTWFYDNPENEQLGIGDKFVCYDDGNASDNTLVTRYVTDVKTISTCTVYFSKDAEPLTQEEHDQVDLIQKAIISLVTRNRLKRTVDRMSYYDFEGYMNLRYYTREIERLNRQSELPGMVAIRYNLSHFSLVNSQIGRKAGDEVMKRYTGTMRLAAGEDGLVCRIGGDNFIMYCPAERYEAVLKVLKGVPIVYDDNSNERVRVASSAGVFFIPDNFEYHYFGDVMAKITTASEQARTGGGDSIVIYDEKTELGRDHIIKVQSVFGESLRRGEFKVFYQPKVSVTTGELMGAEALCRWFHDDRIISPDEFIPVLEMDLNICKLDFNMLDQVCRDIRRWLDEGKRVVRVSINLSRKHMADMDIKEHILEIVDRHNVPHEYIEIELTETTADVEFTYLKDVVNGLREVGICTSIDDFGIGYSSLNLLGEIPWDVLKVDKSFLPEDDEDKHSTHGIMFRHVLALANEIGMESVAEGVETERQVRILRANNCTLAQGYYFDRPMPVENFEERLDNYIYELPQ